MFDISKLKPITAAEWPHVRDIVLPVQMREGGAETIETLTSQAVCYTGDLAARRLHNPEDEVLNNRIFPLLTQAHIAVSDGKKRFRIDFEGMSFRAQLGQAAHGYDLTLRVLPQNCPRLADLRMPQALKVLLLGRELLEGGLILFVAPNGQGKTTTASATLVSRLEAFGGYAQTIEDPCELPLHGVWNTGVCIQRPAEVEPGDETPGDGFFRSLIDSMRQFPAIPYGTQLFVGEIQDSRTAVETLKAALHGHLVIATLHARSPVDAVRRLASMCANGRDNMDPDMARELLASAIRGVWYQSLKWDRNGEGWNRGQLSGQILWSAASPTIGKAIGGGRYDQLADLAKRQTDAMGVLAGQSTPTPDTVLKALGTG